MAKRFIFIFIFLCLLRDAHLCIFELALHRLSQGAIATLLALFSLMLDKMLLKGKIMSI